jgi:hypothetical protein
LLRPYISSTPLFSGSLSFIANGAKTRGLFIVAVSGKYLRPPAQTVSIYSVGMAKILHNWTYRDVTHFLNEKGFNVYEDLGHVQS